MDSKQQSFFSTEKSFPQIQRDVTTTFLSNLKLPVHRWFRYTAGFSAEWVTSVIAQSSFSSPRVFDPFAGSATTLLAAEAAGVESWGIDSHPFVSRIAKAKLAWRSDPSAYLQKIRIIQSNATKLTPKIHDYPQLIRECYDDSALSDLDCLRQSFELASDSTPASELAWLTLIGVLRRVSRAGTAPWQYVLPKRQKSKPADVRTAFSAISKVIYNDMSLGQTLCGPRAQFIQSDARTCEGVPKHFANLIITSPPYPNNYDYADATRLEMTFMGEVVGWGDLQEKVRKYLIRSCSQHVPQSSMNLDAILESCELEPIRSELGKVCKELAEIRNSKVGKKTYHLMVACYFRDLAQVWRALRLVCNSPSKICFVIGDSAPYGVYVPTAPWLGRLAIAAGFTAYDFEKTRDRNVKWKNRKHRVPLQEGRLWVKG